MAEAEGRAEAGAFSVAMTYLHGNLLLPLEGHGYSLSVHTPRYSRHLASIAPP